MNFVGVEGGKKGVGFGLIGLVDMWGMKLSSLDVMFTSSGECEE